MDLFRVALSHVVHSRFCARLLRSLQKCLTCRARRSLRSPGRAAGDAPPDSNVAANPLLTVDKLKIYEQFDGDIDGWARASRAQATTGMTDEDWYLIGELLMGLATVKSGVASASYAQQVEERLLACTSDQATRSILHALATRRGAHDVA